jgi:hypothetical protein
MSNHSHTGGNPDPHVIEQGADLYIMRAAYSDDAATVMPGMTDWTGTYVVFPNGDTTEEPVIALGTTAGVTIAYNNGTATTTTTAGVTLGLSGGNEVATTLSANALQGATTVTVTSATGLAIGDHFTIVRNDGAIHVTRIANLATTTVTLATALSDAADSGNVVKAFDPQWALSNILIYLDDATTTDLVPWGTGKYQLTLYDSFDHTQLRMNGTCCLEGGNGYG